MAEGNDGSARSFARAWVVTTLVGAAYLWWLAGDLGGARTDMLVSDLVFVVTPVSLPGRAGARTAETVTGTPPGCG